MFLYIKHDLKNNLESAIRTGDKRLINDIIADEIGKAYVYEKEKLISILNDSGIKMPVYDKKTISTAITDNIGQNQTLRNKLMKMLLSKYHKEEEFAGQDMRNFCACFEGDIDPAMIEEKALQHELNQKALTEDKKEIQIDTKGIAKRVLVLMIGITVVAIAGYWVLNKFSAPVISPLAVTPPLPQAVPAAPVVTQPSLVPPPKV